MNVRTEDLEGRPHLVVPTVMITVGVHRGSKGPVFYPEKPLRDSTRFWDGKPLVVYHPDMLFNYAANIPQVFSRQKVGNLFTTRFEAGRLKTEAWIDVDRAERVDGRVLAAVRSRKTSEVSTGMVLDLEATAGVFNGKEFYRTVVKIYPDHLAILPDQRGACSVADGAGLCRNSSTTDGLPLPVMNFAGW